MLVDFSAHEFHARGEVIHPIDAIFDTDPAVEAFVFNVPKIAAQRVYSEQTQRDNLSALRPHLQQRRSRIATHEYLIAQAAP